MSTAPVAASPASSGLAGGTTLERLELADRLPAAPEPLGDPRADRHRAARAAVELLGGLGPTLLVLEDLHWADDATVDLISVLLPKLPANLVEAVDGRRRDRVRGG